MIKSPIYLAGNKFKLLPQILPLFPRQITDFVDLFGGSGTVLMNVNADKYYYNEKNSKLFYLFKIFDDEHLLDKIQYLIHKYSLSNNNEEGYLKLRTVYNQIEDEVVLLTLICHSFSNTMRFNKKGGFNVPFGKRTLTEPEIQNIKDAYNFFITHRIIKTNLDFQDVIIPSDSFVYCDPPYFGSVAVYNEGNSWLEKDESRLRNFLQNLTTPWALSNELVKNTTLREWAEDNKYNIHGLNFSYASCNYHRKQSGTEEVLITSY